MEHCVKLDESFSMPNFCTFPADGDPTKEDNLDMDWLLTSAGALLSQRKPAARGRATGTTEVRNGSVTFLGGVGEGLLNDACACLLLPLKSLWDLWRSTSASAGMSTLADPPLLSLAFGSCWWHFGWPMAEANSLLVSWLKWPSPPLTGHCVNSSMIFSLLSHDRHTPSHSSNRHG